MKKRLGHPGQLRLTFDGTVNEVDSLELDGGVTLFGRETIRRYRELMAKQDRRSKRNQR